MEQITLKNSEAGRLPYNTKWIVKAADVAALGAKLSGVISLASGFAAGDEVGQIRAHVITPFDGGDTSSLDAKIGYNLAAGSDDDDAFLTSAQSEWHVDSTETLNLLGAGASNALGYKFMENGNLELTLTAVGANLDAITTGEVHIYGNVFKKSQFI